MQPQPQHRPQQHTEPVFPGSAEMGSTQEAPEDEKKADIYAIITSDPLSKIFLAEYGTKSP